MGSCLLVWCIGQTNISYTIKGHLKTLFWHDFCEKSYENDMIFVKSFTKKNKNKAGL